MAIIQSGASADLATVDSTHKALHVLPKGTTFVDFNNNSHHVDAFERLRVSEPILAFAYSFNVGIISYFWDSAAFGAGTATPAVAATPGTPNQDASVWLNTTTATGTGYWVQSLQHPRYAPGISNLARFTFVLDVMQPGQIARVGMFTDQGTFPSTAGDGLYLEFQGTAVNLVRRYMTTAGTGGEERISQALWNMDKLDGTGASGVNLDWTKAQHLVIQWQWLGVGSIRMGFETKDGIVWAHEFYSVNNLSVPWSRTGSLPFRAEIYTVGTVSQAGRLRLVNCSLLQEGLTHVRQDWRHYSANSGGTAKVSGTTADALYPIMALRPASTNDFTKRSLIVPTRVRIMMTAATTSTSAQWALVYGPTTLTGASFVNVQTGADRDVAATAATAIAGGVKIAGGIFPNVSAGTFVDVDLSYLENSLFKVGLGAAGTAAATGNQVLVLCHGPLTGTTAAVTSVASIDWKELM